MIVSIIKCKSKDWREQFKKEFGEITPDTTLQDVVNNQALIYGYHVEAFIREKKDERKEDVSSSRKARQNNSKGKRFVDSPFKAEAEKEELAV